MIALASTDANVIFRFIRQVKMKYNCLSYDVLSEFLKFANTVDTKWYVEHFNRCFNAGVFPNSLRIACITPVLKIRNRESSADYRSISVLPALSKMLENFYIKEFTLS